MGFVLGIDGGGTKIDCALADEAGEVLARATGPGANLRRTRSDELHRALTACFDSLRAVAGVAELRPEVVCAGLAGAADPAAQEMARQVLDKLLHPRTLYVVGDMEIALEAAVGDGPGGVLIAGTGSIAFGRNAAGKTARAGGEGARRNAAGELTGDAGSGFDIGRRALEAIRETETILAEAVMAVAGVETADELQSWLVPERAPELASLVPLVTRAARRGDPVAREILEQAGIALAGLAERVLLELAVLSTDFQVFLTGGVFTESPEVLTGVRRALQRAAPRATAVRLEVPPVDGALRLAQRLWLTERTSPRA
ncbi:MAG TPA: BadF/BadG/BcrA/BcrD ATPase family protein [Candidatus Xenobia bacterium]|nr:BadF/BadG/BcrA/BcrD ATPase family protein [Candidatus Xenobia bacterium]